MCLWYNICSMMTSFSYPKTRTHIDTDKYVETQAMKNSGPQTIFSYLERYEHPISWSHLIDFGMGLECKYF